jgi:aldehyde:ferredoxin oxidoreductase
MKGYAGKILRVDLSRGSVREEDLRDDFVEEYIGGEGFAAKLLWDEVKPGTEPFSPANELIFSTTALTRTSFPGASKTILCFKSPLTNFYGETAMSGDFAPYLKSMGYDALMVSGRAKEPVYLWIGKDVEIRDAAKVWGKLAGETDEVIRKETGDKASIIRIGPAGENLNRLAVITSGYNHAFGKGGNGAVAGSKKLKAIVVEEGKGRGFEVYDPEKFRQYSSKVTDRCTHRFKLLSMNYMHWLVPVFEKTISIPVHHWQSGEWPQSRNLYHDKVMEKWSGKNTGCWGCPIGRQKVIRNEYGHEVNVKLEAMMSWGYNFMIDNLDDLFEIFYMCAQNGVDINGSAEWAGWVGECLEKGILKPEDLDGLEVKFGDGKSAIKLLDKIFKREGIGDILAEGPKIAAEKLHRGEELVMHVKGAPLEGEEYRASKAFLLGIAVQEKGGSVNRNWTFPINFVGGYWPGVQEKKVTDPLEEKGNAQWVKRYRESMITPYNTVGGCFILGWMGVAFNGYDARDPLEAYKYLTGREISVEEGLKIGERIINLSRAFNAREGFSRKDDSVPERFLKEPVRGGINDGAKVEDFDGMIDEFYTECGFDLETGWPTRAKLEELGLTDVADTLYGGR